MPTPGLSFTNIKSCHILFARSHALPSVLTPDEVQQSAQVTRPELLFGGGHKFEIWQLIFNSEGTNINKQCIYDQVKYGKHFEGD